MSYGRRKIFSDATEITAENVVRKVNAAYLVHLDNRNEIIKLYRLRMTRCYKGRAFCPPYFHVTIHTMTCSTTKMPNKISRAFPVLSDGTRCWSSQTPFFINSR